MDLDKPQSVRIKSKSESSFLTEKVAQESVFPHVICTTLQCQPSEPSLYILALRHKRDSARNEAVNEETVTIYQQHPHYTEQIRERMAPYYLAL
ncbi:hypothetical protein [Endozoicomonas sp.]|uniref:hypothetical protein n=1 Tax=Endozoicomonas sp. TaxID=1892382 RepID=UPI0028855F43|nr:hypothetical protein [Endozoicomonas sp.]